jgi:hypothetical protein
MTQVGEAIAIEVDVVENVQTHDCEWKECKKNHEKAITYPKGGTVERNGTYASDWAAIEPWKLYGDGTDSKATLSDYRGETPGAAYAATAAAMTHPAYHTQKHHLISVKLFKDVKKLSHNAELIKYDVNDKANGVCLPSYVVDIVRHDLQCHRGSHRNDLYYDKITPLLKRIEDNCVKYCEADLDCDTTPQKELIADLERLSARTLSQVRAWKWLLRSNALAERLESRQKLASRSSTT